MDKKKTKEQIEKEREEYLDLKKHKEELANDVTKQPPKIISGWGSRLKEVKKDRMKEKQVITRQRRA